MFSMKYLNFTQFRWAISICISSVSSFLGSSTLNHRGLTIFGVIVGKIGIPEFIMTIDFEKWIRQLSAEKWIIYLILGDEISTVHNVILQ